MAALLIIRRPLLRLPRGQWKFILLYGFVLSLFNAMWTVSVVLNGAAVSTVLVYSSAAFTAVIAWRLFGEKLTATRVVAILLSLSGCALVSGAFVPSAWRTNALGVFTGLISGLGFTVYSLMGKETARRGISSWTALFYTFGFASLLLAGYNFILPRIGGTVLGSPSLIPALDAPGWLALVSLAVVPTIGGYGLYNLSLNFLPATISNLIATLEPSLTAVQSYFLLGERFSLAQISGSLLIISGVVILRLIERRAESEKLPAHAPGSSLPAD
jgi:drug/metabolite transporter (DMT)-like permease